MSGFVISVLLHRLERVLLRPLSNKHRIGNTYIIRDIARNIQKVFVGSARSQLPVREAFLHYLWLMLVLGRVFRFDVHFLESFEGVAIDEASLHEVLDRNAVGLLVKITSDENGRILLICKVLGEILLQLYDFELVVAMR